MNFDDTFRMQYVKILFSFFSILNPAVKCEKHSYEKWHLLLRSLTQLLEWQSIANFFNKLESAPISRELFTIISPIIDTIFHFLVHIFLSYYLTLSLIVFLYFFFCPQYIFCLRDSIQINLNFDCKMEKPSELTTKVLTHLIFEKEL